MKTKKGLKNNSQLGQDEVYDLLTSDEVSWKSILYDLVNSEQLDPWDIDIGLLARKYLQKIKQLEEANFFISSKVLYAASLLLKMKSSSLLNKHLRGIDEILFGKKEEEKSEEKIEIDESKLPELLPKTPLPRRKKVSVDDLVNSLNKAMNTERRRIKKKVKEKQAQKQAEFLVPKRRPSIKKRIKDVYSRVISGFKKKKRKISYSELAGNNKEERIACFLPCLHLHNQEKLVLEQERPFSEVWIWLFKHYKSLNSNSEEISISSDTGVDNPLADLSTLSDKPNSSE